MKRYDEQKTMELINSLKDNEVNVIEQLPAFLNKTLLEVTLSAGKGTIKTANTVKALGLNIKEKDTEIQGFVEDYIDAGKIYFFPKSYERKLESLVARIRRQIERKSVAVGIHGYFVTQDDYLSIKKDFLEAKKEYFAVRDEMLDSYDYLRNIFEKKIRRSFSEFNAVDKEILIQDLLSQFPEKNAFANRFYMELTVRPYPVMTDSVEGFAEEVVEDMKQSNTFNAIDTFYQMIGKVLSNLYEKTNAVLEAINQGKSIANKTMAALKKAIEDSRNANSILKNDRITEIIDIVETVLVKELNPYFSIQVTIDDEDEKKEIIEVILANIYGYAKYLDIPEMINLENSVLSEKELEEIWQFKPDLNFKVA